MSARGSERAAGFVPVFGRFLASYSLSCDMIYIGSPSVERSVLAVEREAKGLIVCVEYGESISIVACSDLRLTRTRSQDHKSRYRLKPCPWPSPLRSTRHAPTRGYGNTRGLNDHRKAAKRGYRGCGLERHLPWSWCPIL